MSFTREAERALLRESAREALGRHDWLGVARAALDGGPPPDAWPAAVAAGWTGVLVGEAGGGAGLGPAEGMALAVESGRRLADPGLLAHLPATWLLQAAGNRSQLLRRLAAGERRAAWVASPRDVGTPVRWRANSQDGPPTAAPRTPEPRRSPDLRVDDSGRLHGSAAWVPGAADADLLVVACRDRHGRPAAVLVSAEAATRRRVTGYDASRPIGHVTFDAARAERLAVDPRGPQAAHALAQALLAAEAIGAAERLLEAGVAHARRRHAFGRPIGSFQAVKHQLVEVLRRLESARALMAAAGSLDALDEDFVITACALRVVAGGALDFAARTVIAVHGGMGVAWESDLPLYFRRAQSDRRLLGGAGAAAELLGTSLLNRADAAP